VKVNFFSLENKRIPFQLTTPMEKFFLDENGNNLRRKSNAAAYFGNKIKQSGRVAGFSNSYQVLNA